MSRLLVVVCSIYLVYCKHTHLHPHTHRVAYLLLLELPQLLLLFLLFVVIIFALFTRVVRLSWRRQKSCFSCIYSCSFLIFFRITAKEREKENGKQAKLVNKVELKSKLDFACYAIKKRRERMICFPLT